MGRLRLGATSITDRASLDVSAAGTGANAEPVYADSGEVLTVALPASIDTSESVVLLETSAGGALASGITVEAKSSTGEWGVAGVVHPRRQWSTQAVAVGAATELRLTFGDAFALRFAGRLASAHAESVKVASLLAAAGASQQDWTESLRQRDSLTAVVAARDTLSLIFEDVPVTEGMARDWYLVLDGTPVSAQVAAFLAGRAQQESSAPVTAFRLLQNVPNPFRHTTGIAFELPIRASVRLEIFDLQGRLVRRFAAAYDAGRHRIDWNLRGEDGQLAAPGIYAYRLSAGRFRDQRKLVVLP